jgi:nucleoside phosphorylase
VTFARPEESRAFRRRLEGSERLSFNGNTVVRGRLGTTELLVAHTGIGPAAAKTAIASIVARERFWLVIGAGFAGGLDPKLALGDTVLEELPSGDARRIVSTPLPVETVAAKRSLRAETGAAAVDMETDTLAGACANFATPFLAIRAISDPAHAELPVPFSAWFDLARQRARPIALLAYLARNSRKLPGFVSFVRGIPRISAALALAVEGRIRGFEHI